MAQTALPIDHIGEAAAAMDSTALARMIHEPLCCNLRRAVLARERWARQAGHARQAGLAKLTGPARPAFLARLSNSRMKNEIRFTKNARTASFTTNRHESGWLGMQLGNRGHKQIKQIPLSNRTLLAFRNELDGDFKQG